MRLGLITAMIPPALCAGGLAGCTKPPPEVVTGVSIELAEHRRAIISEVHYELELAIPADADADIDAFVSIGFRLADTASPLQIDFKERADRLRELRVNGAESDYRFLAEHIVVPARELVKGENRIEIRFTAGSSSLNRNPDYLYSLFVPDRARTAFPLFDQPDLKATYRLSLRLPPGWTAMANAPLETVLADERGPTYRFAQSDLISSYLFAFVAGEFTEVTREVGGRSMTLLHRETDSEKVARNIDAVFTLHATALDWLEDYTGIAYPYRKFGFALIPSFQYSGMEHVGAILYRASSLFLDEAPSEARLLDRAGLIAHETAHMWFGNLVTMQWFDDVWTKEVFANFMADKIVNPSFPDIDHDLSFLVQHYPSAYSVDRTAGANAIRQELGNLNEAGQLYGPIIYDKAPIMMRQLEMMLGADAFRDGLREYLSRHAFANASWPALIEILDAKSDQDLKSWSEVWVNTAGRPEFEAQTDETGALALRQHDPGLGRRVWPQQFAVAVTGTAGAATLVSDRESVRLAGLPVSDGELLYNADGRGYGLFPAWLETLAVWPELGDVAKASLLINLYERMLTGSGPAAANYFERLFEIVARERNPLVLDLALAQLKRVYWGLLPDAKRDAEAAGLERMLWDGMLAATEPSRRKVYFGAFSDIALTPEGLQRARDVWSDELRVENLLLGENDRIDLAQTLALKLPGEAEGIIATELARIANPDSARRLEFVAPSLAAERQARDRFFASLADERRRQTESWVLEALANLHHPLRRQEAEHYILPSLELLEEIQVTGDIFFPTRWLDATLRYHRSATAVDTLRRFLEQRPDYNAQLRMKILQSADLMLRAHAML